MEYAESRQWSLLLGGLALGAVAMYLADPAQGRRRRALLQDKLRSVTHHAGDTFDMALRDTGNRWQGVRAGLDRLLHQRQVKPIDDHVLEARVRSRLGRKVAHPHAVHVAADKGRITLSGPVLAAEHPALLLLVQAIPGVEEIKDRLELHEDAGRISALQGEGRAHKGNPAGWLRTPAAALTGGTALAVLLLKRTPLGNALLLLAGAGLLAGGIGRTRDGLATQAHTGPAGAAHAMPQNQTQSAPEEPRADEGRGQILH